jgi:hypothetical protein
MKWIGALLLAVGCTSETEAIARGVGAACSDDADCDEEGQRCLTEFGGGYCGIADCTADADCPSGSACVTDDDFGGRNFCFLICVDKPECNVHRPVETEANCVSSLDFVDGTVGRKACRPPLSGS